MAGVTQQQLDGIGTRFDKGFDEIKTLMRSFDERIRTIEMREASSYPLLTARIEAAEKELVLHKKENIDLLGMIQLQNETVETLSVTVKQISGWGKWAAGIVTVLITSGLVFFIGRLIYLVLTGSIQ